MSNDKKQKITYIPFWIKFSLLFWTVSFFILFIPSWLYKISEGHCGILPDFYCIPAVTALFLSRLMTVFEYPVNVLLNWLDPFNQFYSEIMIFQFDLPKILLSSLLFLFIGILIGLIFDKISNKTIESNKRKTFTMYILIFIVCISIFVQFQNYIRNSDFSISTINTPSQFSAEKKNDNLSYKINSYEDFDNSPFCNTYQCSLIETARGDEFHKYILLSDEDIYLEVTIKNNQFESILILNWDSMHKMKGNDFKVFFDLLNSIDSDLLIDDPNDSAVDYIIKHADNQSIYGDIVATTWGPVYAISSGRENGKQGMFVWRR